MKIVYGNLIEMCKDAQFDVTIHGCNCFHVMGGGIAYSWKEQFPQIYEADVNNSIRGDYNKLGTYTSAHCSYNPHHVEAAKETDSAQTFMVINGYTQYHYGESQNASGILVDYDAVRMVFRKVKNNFGGKNLRFGYPMIGAGLAKGNWQVIQRIIYDEMKGENHTLVVFA